MFFFLGVLLVAALLNFGAVLPYAYFLLFLLWFAGSAVFVSVRIARRGRFSFPAAGLLIGGGLALYFVEPHIGIWILAIFWGWEAARLNPGGILRFWRFLLAVGLLEAILGLAQYFIAPNWILGFENVHGSQVSGTLINHNHFSGLLEMLIPVCLGLGLFAVQRYGDLAKSYIYVFCGALMALSLAFSLSRMGIFSFLISLLLVSAFLVVRQSQRRLAVGLGLGLLALLIAGVVWIGIDVIVDRYAEIASSEALAEEGRMLVYRSTAKMIREIPQGVGLGAYADRFRQYQTFHAELLFDHAHNDYLETAAEWGIIPAALFWFFVLLVFVGAVRRLLMSHAPDEQAILITCVGAMAAMLIHSLADFNLQIPSNAMLFFSFVGIALGVVLEPRITRMSRN